MPQPATTRTIPHDAERYPEGSLLRIPLVRHALADRQVRWAPRGIDRAWTYEGLIPVSLVGFNPFAKRIFYGASSRLARWLKRPAQSARALNAGDFLVHEVLFAVHDYLHVWATLAINHLAPAVGLGTARITAENLDDLAFCHIVTEAAATAGLDYWYLSTVRFNDVCDVGSRLRGPLTVSYHEDDLGELRRFDPRLEVQSPRFFGKLVRLYCEGAIDGFDVRDVDRSPLLLQWMRHELTYARTQREGIRGWLGYLAGPGVAAPAKLGGAIDLRAPWKQALVERVGALLWEKVKNGVLHRFRPSLAAKDVWRAPPGPALDYRYVNARVVKHAGGAVVEESFPWLAWQTASARKLETVDRRGLALLETAIEARDMELVEFLLKEGQAVERGEGEVRDLFFPN